MNNNQIIINCRSIKERDWLEKQIITMLIRFREDDKDDSPALIYDSRKAYNQRDIHSGFRKD